MATHWVSNLGDGSDSNDGLSDTTPKANPYALTVAHNDTVNVKGGGADYDRPDIALTDRSAPKFGPAGEGRRLKIYLDIRGADGTQLVKAKWYPANEAAALLSHLIPDLHGPSRPIIGADWQPPASRPTQQKEY